MGRRLLRLFGPWRSRRPGGSPLRLADTGVLVVLLSALATAGATAGAAGCTRGNPSPPPESTIAPSATAETSTTGAKPAAVAPTNTDAAGANETRDETREPARATVTLVAPGAPPRRRLRYSFRPQQREELRLELRTALSQVASRASGEAKAPDMELPRVHIAVAIEPQSVSADGDLLTYAWHVTAATSTAGSTPAQVAEGMRAEVAAVEHLAGTGVVDSQGLSRGVSTEAPSGASDAGATGQMIEQVRQTLRDMAAPLPAQEVGKGARWTKLSELVAKDAVLTQTDAFTLLGLQGNGGTLDDVLAQTAPPQVLRSPGAPDGAEARLESMLASGDAKTHFDLTRLVPQMKFEGTTTMVLSGATGQETPQRMTMTLRIAIAVSGSAP
jgi:hypothetical protein